MNSTFQDLLQGHDGPTMWQWLQTVSEAERQSLADPAFKWIDQSEARHDARDAAAVAVFAGGTLAQIKKLGFWCWPKPPLATQILRTRRAALVQAFGDDCLKGSNYWLRWPWLRALVREGLIRRPEHPHYILGMITGALRFNPGGAFRGPEGPLCLLEQDPQLVDEVWHLFEHEGGGENSLANFDRFNGGGWLAAVLAKLPRERLIRESVQALLRDFSPYRARWFVDLHLALQPTDSELLPDSANYLQLLNSQSPATTELAQNCIDRLLAYDRGIFTPQQLLQSQLPKLRNKVAGQVLKGLSQLHDLAQAHPSLRGEALALAVEALVHSKAEVQSKAIDLLLLWPSELSEQTRQDLIAYVDLLAPSQKNRLASLCDTQAIAVISTVEPTTAGGTSMQGEPVRPPENLADLVFLCSQVLEGEDPIQWELALDGISRLGGQRPSDWDKLVSPLQKRAKAILKKTIPGVRAAFASLLLTWIEGQMHQPPVFKNQTPAIVTWSNQRVQEVCDRVLKRQFRPLLSCPTRANGLVDAETADQRQRVFSENGWKADPGDLQLFRWRKEGGPALTVPQFSWEIEERQYQAYGKTHTHRSMKVNCANYPPDWKVLLDNLDYLDASSSRLLTTFWPTQPDWTFVATGQRLANNLDWWEADWHQVWLIEPLLWAPMTEAARFVLALNLAAKESSVQSSAVESLVQAFTDGRLASEQQLNELADIQAALALKDFIVLGRWAKALEKAASYSSLAQLLVARLLRSLLTRHDLQGQRDAHLLAELLLELAIVNDFGPIQIVAAGKTKFAKAAQKLGQLGVSHPAC